MELKVLIDTFIKEQGTDLYLTYDSPPLMRKVEQLIKLDEGKVLDQELQSFSDYLLSDDQKSQFEKELEFNFSFAWNNEARLRVNVFLQRHHIGLVIRRIETCIPTLRSLNLPDVYGKLIMEKRGLILVTGPTGSGKSTSLAAMIDHRNKEGFGHIVCIEDPIEFAHSHEQCIISQRDVGLDTHSFENALKNALRQHPDVIVVGEVRDRSAMEHAINFSETGHLCLATLHANNANQAIERILNFFPQEKHTQVLLNLSLNLRAILSQRLVMDKDGKHVLALEIMLNEGLIKQLIKEGKVSEIRDQMEASMDRGMRTFDRSLYDLYEKNIIDADTALANADNTANLGLLMQKKEIASRLEGETLTTSSF